MISRHRMLTFATLILAVGGLFLIGCQATAPADKSDPLPRVRPSIIVEAIYPGANATVVADTVAAPIEQHVRGVKGMLHMVSRCTNEGKCTLEVVLGPGVDLDAVLVLVQNRVALAQPLLPEEVKRSGVTVKKKSAGPLLLAALTSPDCSRDRLYLSNYATIQITDELSRLPGVGGVVTLGASESSLQVRLDPDKLAAHGLTAADVTRAIAKHNVQVAPGQIGKPPVDKGQDVTFTVHAQGRLTAAKDFEEIVLRTTAEDRKIYLKDVARVELGAATTHNLVHFNGKPAVILAISPTPQAQPAELSAALQEKLKQLRARLPKDMEIEPTFDFTPSLDAPGYLLLDLDLPAGASAERTRAVLQRCETLVREAEGVQDVLSLSEHPFDRARDRACILIRLKKEAKREQVGKALRTRLEPIHDVVLRLRDVSGPGRFPWPGYPIEIAVHGPDADMTREQAQRLAGLLRGSKKLDDVWVDPASTPQPQMVVDIHRIRARERGVTLEDVMNTLQTFFDKQLVWDLNGLGRTVQIVVLLEDAFRKKAEDLGQLKVRNAKGEMIPLSALVTLREITGAAVLDRLDGQPMVALTANLTPGLTLAEARTLAEALAKEVLPAEYRLTWLRELPAAK